MTRFYFLLISVVVFIVEESVGNTSITFPQGQEGEKIIEAQTIQKVEEIPTTSKGLAHHVASIGLKTLRDLVSGHSNLILSPLNIYSCLGILHLGAAGETKEEIRRVIGPQNMSRGFNEEIKAGDDLSHASALFLDHGFVPKSSFVDSALNEYQTSILNVNISDGEGAKNVINSWVSNHTNGTIRELLQGRLDSDTKMVLVTALLFKGAWMHSFPPAATTMGKFELDDGSSVDVPLMHSLATVPLLRNTHFDAIGLPYKDNGMTMHLILPKVHGISALKKLLSHFNVNSFKKLRKEFVKEEIFVVVPKLKIDARFSLSDSLKKQGIGSMFNPSKANFTNVSETESGLFVSQVYHSVHFEMNEEGTVASAATASILTKSSKFIFRANRPFIFVITNEADLVLFMGVVVRPE